MNVNVRAATHADAHPLARLRYEFRASSGETLEGEQEFVSRCAEWMSERLKADGAWRCWVAEDEAQLIGNVWLQLIEKVPNPTPEPERHAYISNLFVREAARGRGVGSALLTAALDCCAARGIHAVILWPTNRSRPLYLRHGFSAPADILESHVS
ncbi:MAG TPA: GNAT family N-acetyltransferase [Pyrinomonadaceae bacterium]|nr:GNAT family N-acetyltransferase [Pyrinomonadaceae bacterium]